MEQAGFLTTDEGLIEERRCVAIIDAALPAGKAANAAAVLALTTGARHPDLVGEELFDSAGNNHPGLISIGIPVLGAPRDELPSIRRKAADAGIEVVDFPIQGQQTNDYTEFRRMLKSTDPEKIAYLGLMLLGAKKKVSRIVSKYSLLRHP